MKKIFSNLNMTQKYMRFYQHWKRNHVHKQYLAIYSCKLPAKALVNSRIKENTEKRIKKLKKRDYSLSKVTL